MGRLALYGRRSPYAGYAGMSNEELERTVVHELVHALVNELREGGIDHEERVVTTLTKAVLWVRDLTRDEAKGNEADR